MKLYNLIDDKPCSKFKLFYMKMFSYIDQYKTKAFYSTELEINELYDKFVSQFSQRDIETITPQFLVDWAISEYQITPHCYLERNKSNINTSIYVLKEHIRELYYSMNRSRVKEQLAKLREPGS